MSTCIELLYGIGLPQADLRALDPGLQAACLQALGAVRAGALQAKAARDAGHWAAAGGGATLAAAGLAFLGVVINRRADERRQARERIDSMKRAVFMPVSERLTGMVAALTSYIEPFKPIEAASRDFIAAIPNLGPLHMTAQPDTLHKVLLAVRTLTKKQGEMAQTRPSPLVRGVATVADVQRWLDYSAAYLDQLNPVILSVTDAVIALRGELGLPLDVAEYRASLSVVFDLVEADLRALLSEERRRLG